MDYVHLMIVLLLVNDSNSAFILDRNDYDAYNLKIVMNEILFVEVDNIHNLPIFSVRFAPIIIQ
jgi:hypothetical protein